MQRLKWLMGYRLNKFYFLVFFIFISFINAKEADFTKCKEFYINASWDFLDSKTKKYIRGVHLGNGNYLAYSSLDLESKNLIKKDPLMSLYLFSGRAVKEKYDLVKINKNTNAAAIGKYIAKAGNILEAQKSFSNFALFSESVKQNLVISDICYQLYGLSIGGNKFIDKKYIDSFLESKLDGKQYLYTGLKIKEIEGKLILDSINPLMIRGVKKGDEIISIENNNVDSISKFEEILNSLPPNARASFTFKRGKEGDRIIYKKINLKPRVTPFREEESFLEYFGIYLSDELVIMEDALSFRKGDKILMLNKTKVKNIQELNNAIEAKKDLSILINRNDFEIFITIKGE